MGYSFLYILCFLIIAAFLIRIFVPFIVYLFPVFLIVFVIKSFMNNRKSIEPEQEYSEYQEDTNYQNSYTSSDVIDVDYTVVDEETNTH